MLLLLDTVVTISRCDLLDLGLPIPSLGSWSLELTHVEYSRSSLFFLDRDKASLVLGALSSSRSRLTLLLTVVVVYVTGGSTLSRLTDLRTVV